MDRKGNAVWIVLEEFNDVKMRATTYEIYTNGVEHQLSSENVNYYELLDLAETFFNKLSGLRSVMITFRMCYNNKEPGKTKPRFCITRNQDGSYKFKVYEVDNEVRELIYIDPTKLKLALQKALAKYNRARNARSYAPLDIGAIL